MAPSEPTIAVDLGSLLRRRGARRQVEVDVRPDGVETSSVRADQVSGALTLESMGEKLAVTGSLEVAWTGDCRRCLEVARGVAELEVEEIYEALAVDGETYALPDDDVLDLWPMIAEQAVLVLPLAPLCGPDCAGPAPDTYPATVATDEEPAGGEAERAPDPRWAALGELTFEED